MHDYPAVAQSSVVRADHVHASAVKSPKETGRHVEQISRRPAHIGGFASLGVEKPSAVIEGLPPFGV
jgi:hypothetical protein